MKVHWVWCLDVFVLLRPGRIRELTRNTPHIIEIAIASHPASRLKSVIARFISTSIVLWSL